jgi:hypothetical protein
MRCMLIVIAVISANEWHVNTVSCLLSFAQWIQWTHSDDTTAVLHRFYWLKTDTGLTSYQISTTPIGVSNFMFKHMAGQLFHASAQILSDIRSKIIPFNFLLRFSFDILTFVVMCPRLVTQALSKVHQQEYFWFGKKCESGLDKLHSALCTFTVIGSSHTKWISELFSFPIYFISNTFFPKILSFMW